MNIKHVAAVLIALLSAGPATHARAVGVAREAVASLSLPDLSGQRHTLASWRGRVVVLNFWASWCAPCRAELPSLWRMQHKLHNRDLVVASVNVGERPEIVRAMLPMPMQRDFVVLLDRSRTEFRRWRIRALPATFVLDRDGHVHYTWYGGRKWDDPKTLVILREMLSAATAQARP